MDPIITASLIAAGSKIGSDIFGMMNQQRPELHKLPTMNRQQNRLFNQMLPMLSGMWGKQQNGGFSLQDILDPNSEYYQNLEDPYRREFEQQTIPMLSERFAGFGGGMGGALSSSGFGQSLGAAGANLQSNLASMKSQQMRQSLSDMMGFSQNMLGMQPFAYAAY